MNVRSARDLALVLLGLLGICLTIVTHGALVLLVLFVAITGLAVSLRLDECHLMRYVE